MKWLRKLLVSKKKRILLAKAEEFLEKVCDALRYLGEPMITCRDEAEWCTTAFNQPGQGQISIGAYISGVVIISIPSIEWSSIYEGFLEKFLTGRRISCMLRPEDLSQADPEKIALEFHELAVQYKLVAGEIKKIQDKAWKEITKINRATEEEILQLLQ